MSDRTLRLHRVLRATPERLFRALTDPRAMVKWSPPHGFIAEVHSMDLRVGGGYRMSFINLGTGAAHSFSGRYIEIMPNERLRYTDAFDDPSMPGAMTVTVTLRAVLGMTELTITQENIPAQIPLEMCYLGWQESLNLLALLTDPAIP